MEKREVKVEEAVIVCQDAMMQREVESELKKHGVSKVILYDKPSQLNGQLEPRKSKRPVLLLFTGREDTSWDTIQSKYRSCPKTDKLLVRSSNNRIGLYSRLLYLGADKILKRDEDVWEAIQKLFGSE